MNYTTKDKKVNKSKIGRLVLVCLFWLVIWQIAALIVDNSLLLPTVFETVQALGGLLQETSFYMDVLWTLFRCVMSIVISFCLGFLFANLAYKNQTVRSVMTLPVSFFKAVPVMAIVIYVILLVESDWVAVVACFLMCFPIVYTNVLTGLDSVSADLLEVAKIHELNKKDVDKYIFLPSILPSINAAMKIVAGLSWKAVVAAEVLSVPEFSLGQGMISAKYYLETSTLFAYIFVIVALSLCLERVITALTEKCTSKEYQGSKIKVSKNINRAINSDICLRAPKVKLVDVTKSFDEKVVLDKLTEDIDAGEKVAVIGASGSGKTTLVRIITGLEKADGGTVDTTSDLNVSYLFQEDRLLPWLNVYDNLALGMFRKNTSPNADTIISMAKNLELEDVLYKMPEELSGGMRHRVALGRTLLADCNLLVLDEPFRGLDEDLKKRIVDRLWDKSTEGKTVIVITHSQRDVELLGINKSIFVE